MNTQLFVALVFVLWEKLIKEIETVTTDFISRQEFDVFKSNVLNLIQELTLENDKQAKEIDYKKKAILDLKRMLRKYDETSINYSRDSKLKFT